LQEVVYDLSYTLRLPEQQLNRTTPNVLRAFASLATLPVRLYKFGKTIASGEEHGAPLPVLKECQGVLRSGTTTLLVSPPGHGKTSFLRALSGLLPGPAGGSLEGTVRYNGVDILDPKAVTRGAASAPKQQRRPRVVKVYENPHTGELIETKGGNHRGLKAWKEQYGAATVESWVR
jgi:ABC-type branched-subunit amino acid transport system ATPase component